MLFVLGILLFLMAIGASTMAAAAANTGYVFRQNEFNRVRILDESIHDSIRFSLQPPDDVDDEYRDQYLGYHLVLALFEAFKNDPDPNLISSLPPIISDSNTRFIDIINAGINIYDDTRMIHVRSIEFSFPLEEQQRGIKVIPGIAADSLLNTDEIPETAIVNARMIVKVEIQIGTQGSNRPSRTVTSAAVYNFMDGRLIIKEASPGIREVSYDTDGYGTWELLNYEIISTQVHEEDEEDEEDDN